MLLERLIEVAEPLANLTAGMVARHIVDRPGVYEWAEKAEWRMQFSSSAATNEMGRINTLALLAVERSEEARQIGELFENEKQGTVLKGGAFDLCQTEDPTTMTLLRVVDWVPLKTATLYRPEAWEANAVLPSAYVWPAEQIAAELEGEARFSTRFMSWLAADETLLRSVTLGLLYGAVQGDEGEWEIAGIGRVEAGSECELLASLFDPEERPAALRREGDRRRALRDLAEAIGRCRPQETDRRQAALLSFGRERVEQMKRSEQLCERDLGRYLAGLIDQERGVRA
jgi:hypothetical protein